MQDPLASSRHEVLIVLHQVFKLSSKDLRIVKMHSRRVFTTSKLQRLIFRFPHENSIIGVLVRWSRQKEWKELELCCDYCLLAMTSGIGTICMRFQKHHSLNIILILEYSIKSQAAKLLVTQYCARYINTAMQYHPVPKKRLLSFLWDWLEDLDTKIAIDQIV